MPDPRTTTPPPLRLLERTARAAPRRPATPSPAWWWRWLARSPGAR